MGRRGPLPREKDAEGKPLDPSSAVAVLERRAQIAGGAGAIVDAPAPPGGLLPASREVWADFWGSKPARWVDRGAAMHRLVRWIRDVDMYERISRDLRPRRPRPVAAGETPSVSPIPGVVDTARPWLGRGAAEQIRRHPNADLIEQLDERIHRVEVEFGMTPYAAVRLGLAGVQGALTAEQLRALFDERRRHGDSGEPPGEWSEGFEPA